MMGAAIAFLASPLGISLVTSAPQLVAELIGIWHKEGKITTQEIADYIASQIPGDVLVPKKT